MEGLLRGKPKAPPLMTKDATFGSLRRHLWQVQPPPFPDSLRQQV